MNVVSYKQPLYNSFVTCHGYWANGNHQDERSKCFRFGVFFK